MLSLFPAIPQTLTNTNTPCTIAPTPCPHAAASHSSFLPGSMSTPVKNPGQNSLCRIKIIFCFIQGRLRLPAILAHRLPLVHQLLIRRLHLLLDHLFLVLVLLHHRLALLSMRHHHRHPQHMIETMTCRWKTRMAIVQQTFLLLRHLRPIRGTNLSTDGSLRFSVSWPLHHQLMILGILFCTA